MAGALERAEKKMIVSLHMKNIALVREEEISFGPGLNILTGETGAGKSIIIGGVEAALGAGSLKELCAQGADYALVELVFETDQKEVAALLEAWEIPMEDAQIILSRKYQNGRTINRINGETVPAAHLQSIAALLIDIHGQHQHQSLLRPHFHRVLLDRYAAARLEDLPEKCANSFRDYQEKEKAQKEACMDEAARVKQADLLRYEIGEIEDACLLEGEDEELEEQFRVMSNGQHIMECVAQARELTCQEEGALPLISRAVRALSGAASCDRRVQDLLDQLMELESLSGDFERSLTDYADSFTYDEETFARTGERLDTINRLKLKYGKTIADIHKSLTEKQAALEKLEHYEQYRARLEEEKRNAWEAYRKYARQISQIRKEMAVPLQEQITQSMKDLNFLDVRFEIRLSELAQPGISGLDEAVFCISMNPGMPLRPLQEVASGGELSRIMLAIKSIMADQDQIETLIFDEIDTGISGRTAQKVSEKMALIAGKHQVICITHLAQIAAMADSHFRIDKQVENGQTFTFVTALGETEAVDELARILGGVKITKTVMDSAREMRSQAVKIREEIRKDI